MKVIGVEEYGETITLIISYGKAELLESDIERFEGIDHITIEQFMNDKIVVAVTGTREQMSLLKAKFALREL